MMSTYWSNAPVAVLAWLMTYAIQSTVLFGTIALVTLVVKSEAWRDVMWKTGLIGGVVSSIALSMTLVQPLAGRYFLTGSMSTHTAQALERTEGFASNSASMSVSDVAQSRDGANDIPPSEPRGADERMESANDASFGLPTPVDVRSGAEEASTTRSVYTTWIVAAWLVGVLALVGRLLIRRRSLFALLEDRQVVADGPAAALFGDVMKNTPLRGRVRLTSSPACPVPMALGRAEVCVPARFLVELDADQQRGALAHEAAHLVRRDPAWLFVAMSLEAVFFFQPLNLLARRRLKESAECLCDEWAVRAGSGIGLARCLATVASWIGTGQEPLLARTSAIGERRSALVQRVERLMRGGITPDRRPAGASPVAFGLVVAVALASPAVAVVHAPDASEAASAATEHTLRSERTLSTQENIIRPPDANAPLRQRWTWALNQANARNQRGFWIVYAFDRPVARDEHYVSDSEGWSIDELQTRTMPLRSMLGGGDAYGRGTIAVMFHFQSASREGAIDRIGHRSMNMGMAFGRDPVFWLGTAADAESVPWLEEVLARVGIAPLRAEIVEVIAVHATSTIVLPALARVLADDPADEVRAEAVEGLEHHDVVEALGMAENAARRDASPLVQREAAEAIGGIDVEPAAAVLTDLALSADDEGVRHEAAEALEDQAQARALPALERVIFEANDPRAQAEAAEALAAFGAESLDLLYRVVWEHPMDGTQREAVETIGDIGSERSLDILSEILQRHPNAGVQDEALDALAEIDSPRSRAMLLDALSSNARPEIRREAVERIGDRGKDARSPQQVAEVAALLERLVFQDEDRRVVFEALDAIGNLPRDIATRLLRKVAETHPDAAARREAVDVLDDIR
jgi:HEAT repeat protein